jgi:hypothetical protein
MSPRPLSSHEQQLIEWYSYCQLGMTPQRFYAKWQVSQEEMAAICSRSVSTVNRWFRKGRSYRRPTLVDLRHQALMDFLLDHFDHIPEELRQALCSNEPKDAEDEPT